MTVESAFYIFEVANMIRVGILHSLTGTMSLSELPLVSAAKMAIHEINESGGVLGKKLVPVIVNGASDPLEFSRKALELRDDGITTIFGCWTSACRKSVLNVIEGSNIKLWYPVQYEGLEQSPNIYYTGSTLNQQIEPAIHWCLEHLGKKVFLLGSDYVFPRTSNRLIHAIVSEEGGMIVEEVYHSLGSKNFVDTITRIKELQPDVIFNTLNGESNLSFYKELHKHGMSADKFPVMAVSLGEVEASCIHLELCGHYTCWGYFQSIATTKNQAFVNAFQEFNDTAGVTSDPIATAYSQVHLWAKAVNTVGSLDKEKNHKALMKLNFNSPLGEFKLQKNNHVVRNAIVGKAGINGQFEIVWESKDTIEPLPWLGVEALKLPSANLIKDIMAELPHSIDISTKLSQEIEERKSAERLILSERNRSDSYLKTASVMMLVIDAEQHVVLANDSACKTLGYSEYEILGKNWFENFLPLEGIDDVKGAFNQIISGASEAVEYFENSVRTKSGEERLIAWHNAVIRDNNNKITHIISSGNDITDLKRSEQLAQQTTKVFKMIASTVPSEEIYDAICHMYEAMHPRMRSSILRLQGNHLFHCSAPSLPEEYSNAINGVEIGPYVGSCGTAAFTGKEVIVEDISTDPLWANFKQVALPHKLQACWSEPIRASDGKILGTFAMYFDHPTTPSNQEIDEIRAGSSLIAIAMEKENRETWLKKLSLVIHQAGESMMITDVNGNIEFVNPAFEKVTGYSSKEAVGQNARILNSGVQSSDYYKHMWDTILEGEVWQGKIIDKKKDGTFYPALLMISPIKNDFGDIINFVSVQQDMSDYEALEEQFNQAQKMEAIGTLVGGIAHDFNNTLAGITGNIYLLEQSTAQIPGAGQRLELINSLSMRAAGMISQLLTFARKGLKSMNPVKVSIFLKEILKLSMVSIPENIKVIQNIEDSNMHALADINLLQQVFLNLLNNARDAVSESKEPRISIKLSEFKVTDDFIGTHPEVQKTNFVCIEVEDNGTGIKADDLPHVFEPFFTTKDVGKGTGLGLAMSYGAIKSHEGIIDVESNVGKGTIFKVYLPLLDDNAIIIPSRVDEEVIDGKGETILLVDDEINLVESGRAVLESLGYKVVVAYDGSEAVDVYFIHKGEIDLVITDVVMPCMSGVDAANEIRKINPTAKILFATGYDRTNSFRKNDGLDSDYVLSKPFSAAQLSQKIREILD